MKKVDSAVHSTGEGDGWFKLFDEGYDEGSGKWCNIKVNENRNYLSARLPKGLAGGYYLVRPELLALHAAVSGDPQFFTGCAQIFLDSSGNMVPTDTVSIPGYVSKSDPGLTFNVYKDPMDLPYPIPGPKPANYKKATTAVAIQKTQKEGLTPPGCLLEVGNWCAHEVPSYSDQEGCWDAASNCWDQDKACWASDHPTGGQYCRIWEEKCHSIGDNCKAGNWHGPPQKGKHLTPHQPTINPGMILPTVSGGKIIHSTPTPSKGHPKKGHPKKSHPKSGHPKGGHPKSGHPKNGHPKNGHHQKPHHHKGSHGKVATSSKHMRPTAAFSTVVVTDVVTEVVTKTMMG